MPTFVTFLRDIESGMDVREYCKEYLGEGPAMQQFASDFLEKRRFYKQRSSQHKDDMCVAPTITASSQHSNEFQEVKVMMCEYFFKFWNFCCLRVKAKRRRNQK